MTELDLDRGDADRAESVAARSDRTTRVRSTGGTGGSKPRSSTSSKKSTGTTDSSVATDLRQAFASIADQLESRGDEELSTAIAEEAENMTTGLISMTRVVPFLRKPLILLLGIVIPVLAFWRVGGIIIGRWLANRRLRRQEVHLTPEEQAYANAAAATQ